MAGGPHGGVRRPPGRVGDRHAARRARLAGGHVQLRDHGRTSLRHHHRTRGAARVDRPVPGRTMAKTLTLAREQTRARYPDQEGYVERDGVKVFYEVYGEGDPTIMFVP